MSDKTPEYVDTKLSELDYERYKKMVEMSEITKRMERTTVNRKRYENNDSLQAKSRVEACDRDIASSQNKNNIKQVEVEYLEKKMQHYEDEYVRRGRWTRAFFVANGNGHVHRSRSCSTCYPTTRFQWLTAYSGKTENDVVEDAGDRACTVCYSSAPVETLNRPSRINDPEREAIKAAKAAAKAAKEADAAQKAISNPDGTQLKMNYGGTIRTEHTAEIETVDRLATYEKLKNRSPDSINPEYVKGVKKDYESGLAALAHKHGTTVEDEFIRLAPKVTKKLKAWRRAS